MTLDSCAILEEVIGRGREGIERVIGWWLDGERAIGCDLDSERAIGSYLDSARAIGCDSGSERAIGSYLDSARAISRAAALVIGQR